MNKPNNKLGNINLKNNKHAEIIQKGLDLRNKGNSSRATVELLAYEFKLTTKYIQDKFMVEINKLIANDIKEFNDNTKDEIASKYNYLYLLAVKKGDIKTAATILKNIDSLYGLSTIKVESKNDIVISFE